MENKIFYQKRQISIHSDMHKTLDFFLKEQISYIWFLCLPSCMSRAIFLDINCSLSYKNSSALLAPNAFHAFCRQYHSMSLYRLALGCVGTHIFALFTSVRGRPHCTQVPVPTLEFAGTGEGTRSHKLMLTNCPNRCIASLFLSGKG